jgi:hypothetical protein
MKHNIYVGQLKKFLMEYFGKIALTFAIQFKFFSGPHDFFRENTAQTKKL